MDLSIIIINYNTRALCLQAVEAVRRTTHTISYEVLIVDNSSDEGERYPLDREETVLRVENKGFGHACNRGAAQAQGELLLMLNSDTILHEGTLDKTVSYLLQHPKAGALGIHTRREDGEFDHGCKRGFPTPWRSLTYFCKLDRLFPNSPTFGGYRLSYLDENATHEVDAVSGAFMMVRRSVYEQIGGFDEDFFMYGEDLDLCYRINVVGYKTVYYGEIGPSMTHLKGQSGLSSQSPEILYHFYQSMLLFYNKHYRERYPRIVSWLVRTAVRLKYRMAGGMEQLEGS